MQGTLYPDVVESGGGEGAANIKSHHNVGGLPDDLQFELVEPLRTLFKDEVRAVGLELGVPEGIVWRQPFPGPGLGIRIIGEVTAERLDILRAADVIAREELTRAGLDRDIWQCPVVLLADVRSVGVQGDGRTYGHPVVLRPVSSEDAMTADWTRLPYDVLAIDLDPHHQRGARGQPGGPRRDEQAAGHHRVGVSEDVTESPTDDERRPLGAQGPGRHAALPRDGVDHRHAAAAALRRADPQVRVPRERGRRLRDPEPGASAPGSRTRTAGSTSSTWSPSSTSGRRCAGGSGGWRRWPPPASCPVMSFVLERKVHAQALARIEAAGGARG